MWLGWSLVAIFDFVEILFRILKYPFKMNRRELVIKKRRNSIQAFVTKKFGTDYYDY